MNFGFFLRTAIKNRSSAVLQTHHSITLLAFFSKVLVVSRLHLYLEEAGYIADRTVQQEKERKQRTGLFSRRHKMDTFKQIFLQLWTFGVTLFDVRIQPPLIGNSGLLTCNRCAALMSSNLSETRPWLRYGLAFLHFQ